MSAPTSPGDSARLVSAALTWVVRVAVAVVLVAAGAGLLWVVGGVLAVPLTDGRVLMLLSLKAFFSLTAGTVGLLCLLGGPWLVVGPLLPARLLARRAPAPLRTLCPGCGQSRAEGTPCGSCGAPATAVFSPLRPRPGLEALTVPCLFGVSFLGLFLCALALSDRSLPVVKCVLFAVFGALLVVPGAAAAVGLVMTVGELLRAPQRYMAHGTAHPPVGWLAVHADARLQRGELVAASGWIEQRSQPIASDVALDVPRAHRDVARLLAAAARRGLVSLWVWRHRSWRATSPTTPAPEGLGYRDAATSEPRVTREACDVRVIGPWFSPHGWAPGEALSLLGLRRTERRRHDDEGEGEVPLGSLLTRATEDPSLASRLAELSRLLGEDPSLDREATGLLASLRALSASRSR